MNVEVSSFIVTLEKFHDSQRKANGEETIALRTLEDHAAAGKLPGARKVGGKWFVNLLEWMNPNQAETASASQEETHTPPPPQGKRGSGEGSNTRRAKIPGEKAQEGAPARIRFP